MSPIRLHRWVFDVLSRLCPGRYFSRRLPVIRPKRRSVSFEVDQFDRRESPTSLFAVDPLTSQLVSFATLQDPLPAATAPIAVGQASSLSADRIGDLPAEQAYFSSQAGSLPYAQGQVGNLPPQDGVSVQVGQAFQPDVRLESLTYASAANLSPNLEAIQNPQASFLDPLGLDTITPPHSTKLPAADPMGFPSTTHDSPTDSDSSSAGARPTASSESAGFAQSELSNSSPSSGLSLSVARVSAPATPVAHAPGSPVFLSPPLPVSPSGPLPQSPLPSGGGKKKHLDPMWVLDANKAIVVTPGTADNEFSNTAMDLRMQVSGATVNAYSWDLTNAPDTTGVSGTSTYKLTFNWSSFTGAVRTETIIAKETPQGGSQVTQTLTFTVAGTDSPAWSTAPTSYSNWPSVLLPDALNTMQQTQQIFGCSCGDNIAVGVAAGDLRANVLMPAYNPGVSRLGLVYDSIAANTLPIFITHYQIDPSQAVPPTVKAQLTFNGVAGTTVWYTTSSLNPGDIMEISLQADATALSTGRYSYSIAVTANYGTPATTTYSGSVDIVNSSGSPFGAGWSLSNLERIWPVTGGVVLEEPGGLSLWFANGQPAGNFVRPAGDFSTLTQNTQTNVYTRTMPDGTKINFDSTGKQTSIVDRVGSSTSFGYNGSNLLVTITDPYSLVTTLTYNASNKVSTIQDPAGRTTTLAYDTNNVKLTSVTDPDSDLWQFGYDSANRMTTSTDEDSHLTTYAYGTGRVTTITRADSTTMLLTPVELQGVPAAGTGTQSNPATPVLAVAALAAYTDPRSNIWNTNLDWLGFGEPSQQTDPLSDLANAYRDANGLPWLAADPLARRTRSFFDSLANPTKTVFADDTAQQATYNGFSEPLTQTDELGNVTTMSYDTSGNLLTVTQPPPVTGGTSPVTTNTYDSHGFVLTTTDPNSHTTTFGYDSRDRMTSRTDALNHTATMGYDSASNMTGRTDENGHVVTYTFDSDNRMQTQVLPGSPVSTTTYGYDSIGNMTSVTDPLSHTTTNTYDSLNRLKTVTDPLSHTTTYGYDNNGNRITVTDPLSRITTYTFDNADRMTAVTDPLSHTTTTAYDAAGERITVTDPLSHVTSYQYDSRARLTATLDPLNNETKNGYDAASDLTNVTKTHTSGGFILSGDEATTYTYDNDHRNSTMTDPQNNITTYGYDSAGNLTTSTDPLSHIATSTYDADNRLISVTDALGHTTTYGYDNVGNRTTVTDPLNRVTTYGYDQQNRLVTVTDPLLGVTTYAYDQASRQISVTDAVGNITTNTYDNANRLINVTDPNGHLTTYGYDNANELTSVTDRNGRQTTYSYDNAGRKTGETWVGGSYIATYTYDNANRLTVEQDTFSKYTLSYDNSNRVTNVDNLGTPNAPRVSVTYGYDNFNNITSISATSIFAESFGFDADNRLTSASMASPPRFPNNASVTLAYDSASRLTGITRSYSSSVSTTYSYDNANRLTGITHKSGTTTLMTLTYGYDNANQLTSYGGPDGSITYGYDNDGQLTGATGAHNETYTFDKEGNRTMSGYSTGTGNRLTADGTYTYAYDQDGNMTGRTRTSDGQVTTFTWDYRNRLTEVLIKTSGGVTVQDDKFTYDVENRRIAKNTLSGGQSWTIYSGQNPLADFNNSGSIQYQYLYGNAIDFLLARGDTNAAPLWYLTDKLGSVRENVNSSGTVIDSITYDTFGNIISESAPSSGDRFKYTSREWDSEIGQYFYRARYYGPGIGRFESEDPLRFKARDTDLYRYVVNRPTAANDPDGTCMVNEKGKVICPKAVKRPGNSWGWSWTSGGTGGLTGLGVGAEVGFALGGPPGALIGGVIGGVGGLFSAGISSGTNHPNDSTLAQIGEGAGWGIGFGASGGILGGYLGPLLFPKPVPPILEPPSPPPPQPPVWKPGPVKPFEPGDPFEVDNWH